MKKIYFITSNKGKHLEAKEKLRKINYDVVQKDLGYPEVQANTLEDVAIFGVKHIQNIFDKPFILEDAGLFIDGLNGFPGVYSAYVFHTIGCRGVLKLLKDTADRKAIFKSVFAYGQPDEKPVLFIGECPGTITDVEKGINGFGYDPIFVPNESSRTFAEMKVDEKNNYSHRGRSLDKLINFLDEQEK